MSYRGVEVELKLFIACHCLKVLEFDKLHLLENLG